MRKNKEQGLKAASKLIDKFQGAYTETDSKIRQGYNEAKVRLKFIDALFEALGWDVRGDEVDVEYSQTREDDGSKGRADYIFGVNFGHGKTFYVEAKKPHETLEKSSQHALQARRYAYSAKHPVVILTDFEEFSLYLGRGCEPKDGDTVDVALITELTCKYTEYSDKWDMLWDAFSRESVMAGSLEKLPGVAREKKGEKTVDVLFLADIEQWRKKLAENIHANHSVLSRRALNEVVQKTIDRIIFLRICEDREIEDYGRIRKLLGKPGIYKGLCKLFTEADARYNSGLFCFGQRDSDKEHLALTVDDAPLEKMISRLYFPGGPYAFASMPPDILGQVYERFLGKVIEIRDGTVVVEDKPDVKKAGGVFYTPEYIVEYIVSNTVGRLVEGKKPIAVAKLKIVDPACGSGAFLIKAYQLLLDWHLRYYTANNPKKWEKEGCLVQVEKASTEGPVKAWHLALHERKRILLANIHGVDIDSQAVEVTKLSLFLKCLEGETKRTIVPQLSLWKERVLPDLGRNIKCGNSLIGRDFYESGPGQQFDREAKLRVNAFDWPVEFPEVFKSGGFDAVIGNPPYLRIQGLTENNNNQLEYFSRRYKSAVKRFDLYLLFIEQGFSLLKQGGQLSYICPNKFINSDFGSGLREFLIDNKALEMFVSFGNNLVFSTASTYTGILLLSKTDNKSFNYYEFSNIGSSGIQEHLESLANDAFTKYSADVFDGEPWILSRTVADALLSKIKQPQSLGDVFENILVGVQSGIDNIHLVKFVSADDTGNALVFSEKEAAEFEIEINLLKPMLMGADVHRYLGDLLADYYCIYPYKLENNKTKVLTETELKKSFPLGYKYLARHKAYLKEIRLRQKTNPVYWYSCHRSRDMNVFEQQRIITPEISLGCNMTICPAGLYHNTQVYSLVPKANFKESLHYWLSILNSKLMWFFMKTTGTFLRGGYVRYKTEYLKPFPIRVIEFGTLTDKNIHDDIVQLATNMLEFHRELHKPGLDSTSRKDIELDIASSDRKINALVYQLYGLTVKEIELVEETT